MKYLVLSLTFVVFPLFAEPLVVNDDKVYSLENHLEIVTAPPETRFVEVQKEGFFTNSSNEFRKQPKSNNFWMRFHVKSSGFARNWFLFLNHLNLDYVDFYVVDRNGQYTKQIAGDRIPFTEWSIPYSHPLFRFFLQEGETKTIYFHINTTSNVDFMPAVYGPGALAKRETGVKILRTVNLFVFFIFSGIFFYYFRKNKNKHFLYLIPIVFSYFLYTYFAFGDYYHFWPELPWLQDRFFHFVIICGIYQLIFANIMFLQLRKKSRKLWNLFIVIMLMGIPGWYLFNNMEYFFRSWMVIHAGISLLLILVSSVLIYKRGNEYVKYYLNFQLVIQAGVYIKILNFFGILNPYQWRYNWPAILFPAGILVLIKFAWEEYHNIFRENEELNFKYNELLNKLKSASEKKRTRNLDRQLVLDRISEMIIDNTIFTNEIYALNKMAEFLNIRPDQLSELINDEMQMNFNTLINTVRVHKACELMLEYPQKNIIEIYFNSGFKSKNPFNSAFREILNMTPTEYRDKLNKVMKYSKQV